MTNPDDPQSWMQKVDEDLLTIDNNLSAQRIPWAVVGFHAQQAAEKSLKALLVSRGDTVPLTHDLGTLLRRYGTMAKPLSHLVSECDLLTPYAVANRYPGVAEVSEAQGRAAVAAARHIVEDVRKLL